MLRMVGWGNVIAAAAMVLAVLSLVDARPARAEGGVEEEIIATEKAALDRWGKGDPHGYLEIAAPEATYFDPFVEKRVDGVAALREYYAPARGKIKVHRFDMIEPRVQVHGDTAVLTFNLASYGLDDAGHERLAARWNSTEVYARIEGRWRLIHSHWSHTGAGKAG